MGAGWESVYTPAKYKESGEERYGDEVCRLLGEELEMTDVPNDVFPDGVQFGYFYNYCEKEDWNDSGARSEISVCCQV